MYCSFHSLPTRFLCDSLLREWLYQGSSTTAAVDRVLSSLSVCSAIKRTLLYHTARFCPLNELPFPCYPVFSENHRWLSLFRLAHHLPLEEGTSRETNRCASERSPACA